MLHTSLCTFLAAEDEQEFPSMLDIINTRWLKNERNNEDLPDSRRLVFNRDADDKYSARTIGNSNNLRQHYIIHGWKGNIYEEWVNDTSNAILSKHLDTAVIRLDWHIAADKDYIAAARIVRRSLGMYMQALGRADDNNEYTSRCTIRKTHC